MHIFMLIISFCLAADAFVLILNPALYKKSLVYVHEMLGPAWAVLYGLLFSFCAIFIFISIIFSGISFLYIIAGTAMAAIGVFFILSGMEKYSQLALAWSTLSSMRLRVAGILFLILAALVCYVTALVYFNA